MLSSRKHRTNHGGYMERIVGLQEAARLAVVSITTVRRWAQTGVVAANKTNEGVWQIDRESLIAHVATEPPRTLQGASARDDVDRSVGVAHPSAIPTMSPSLAVHLEVATEYLREALADARQRSSDLERRVTELQADKDSLHRQLLELHAEVKEYLESRPTPKSTAEVLDEVMSRPSTPWWRFWRV